MIIMDGHSVMCYLCHGKWPLSVRALVGIASPSRARLVPGRYCCRYTDLLLTSTYRSPSSLKCTPMM